MKKPPITELPITTVVLRNIEEAERIESKRRYFALSTAISNAIHEICAQYTIISHLILSFNQKDRVRVAEAVNIDLKTCAAIVVYLEGSENLTSSQRAAAMQWVQRKLLDPLIKGVLEEEKKPNEAG